MLQENLVVMVMGAVSIVIIVVVLLAAGILIALTLMSVDKNKNMSAQQSLIPFTASFDPTTGQASPFVDAAGNAQITCPAGSTVNIVGAFYNVFDPYAECSANVSDVSPLLGFLCDPTQTGGQCTTSSDCPQGTGCNGNGQCQLINYTNPNQCPAGLSSVSNSSGNFCVDESVCGNNIDLSTGAVGLPNPYCGGNYATISRCAIRDASALVAAKCDGLSSCPSLSPADFGDYPCPNLSPRACISGFDSFGNPEWVDGMTRTGYCGLPYLPGWPGGVPPNSSNPTSNPANANLGYVMHGIYTCIPN